MRLVAAARARVQGEGCLLRMAVAVRKIRGWIMITRDINTRRILPRKRRCPLAIAVCAAVLVNLGGGGAWAQELKSPDSAAPAQLDEVVVTAQKRAQKVQDVGIDIDAFSGGQLKQLGVDQVTDLARVSPGVNVTGSYAGQYVSFVIRGVQQQ